MSWDEMIEVYGAVKLTKLAEKIIKVMNEMKERDKNREIKLKEVDMDEYIEIYDGR